MIGLSTRGSISLGCALVAGRNRVPRPAAGKTALRILVIVNACHAPLLGRYTLTLRKRPVSKEKSLKQSTLSKSMPKQALTAKIRTEFRVGWQGAWMSQGRGRAGAATIGT